MTMITPTDQDVASLRDKERLLLSIHKLIGSVLPTMTMEAILENVSQALLQAGIFRSIMIALVDQDAQTIEVVTSVVAYAGKRDPLKLPDVVPVPTTDSIVVTVDERSVGLVYPLDDHNVTAQVARTGVLTVVNQWNEQMDARVDTKENWKKRGGKIAYFIPLVFDDEVIGVAATGSLPEEKDAVLARMELIQPLFDLVAASLHHARQTRELNDANQVLRNMQEIARLTLSSLDRQQIVENLSRQLVDAGVLRGLSFSLVDHQAHRVVVVGGHRQVGGQAGKTANEIDISYDLNDPDILAETARTGQMQIAIEEDERFTEVETGKRHTGQVAYFIPIKAHDEVLAVIATGSTVQEKEQTTHRLIGLQPLWDQVAVALSNAALFESAQEEIAQRKQAEEERQRSEQQYQFLAEAIPYGAWQADKTGYCTYVSASFLEMVDMSLGQVQEFGWLHLLPPEDVEPTKDHWLQCVETGEDFEREHRFRQPNGTYRNVLAIGRPFRDASGKIEKWMGLNLDVTERRRAERELEEGRNLLQNVSEIARIGGWALDLVTMTPAFTDEVYRIYDIPQGVPPPVEEGLLFYAPEARPVISRAVEEAIETGTPYDLELPYVTGTGKSGWVRTIGHVELNNGTTSRLVGVIQDITERKQAEAALRESERAHRLALQIGKLGAFAMDLDGRNAQWTPDVAQIWGIPDDFTGDFAAFCWERVHPEDLACVEETFGKLSQAGDVAEMEFRLHQLDGSLRWVRWRGQLNTSEPQQGLRITGVNMDITERKQLEQDVIHLERMRVSGELAAGVSHNLNNMLTAVLGPAQILLRKSDDPQIRRESEAILTAGSRAADLVSRLNQAVRSHQEVSLGPVSLGEQIQEAIQMARPRWKDEPESRGVAVEVLTELAETPDVQGDPAELDDVILNLLLNAVQAMPDGGAITIATQAVDAGILLTVSDTGTGMDEETRRRIFEPFFTTKADIGSGLGLSTVHGTMSRWGGTIEVDSTVGEGTTFTLFFPAFTEPATPVETTETAAASGRSGRLMIVEDDEGICGLLDRLLSETHTIAVVRDGKEALDQFVSGRYDVALIDLGMPGLAGDQVAAQMRRLDPSLATVLITGWGLAQEDVRLRWFDLRIPKPFDDLDEVVSVVAQAVELHDSRG
jgi:PAS domain S-box-containing protein